jgi:hypothetical protein
MGVTAIDDRKYGKLLVKALPRVISSGEELDRMVEMLEGLDFPARKLSPEEEALAELLQKLIQDYDGGIELPASPPHKMVLFLMEQRG